MKAQRGLIGGKKFTFRGTCRYLQGELHGSLGGVLCGIGGVFETSDLGEGSSAPRPQNDTGPWPSRNWATQQAIQRGRGGNCTLLFMVLPGLYLLSDQRWHWILIGV